jgi:ABC-2 type transport system ATP-binding protein
MIEAKGLARTFKTRKGAVEAVRGVDFAVRAGEIVGFLGPNGAGKTTTLRMLTTLLTPTAGTATVAGCDLLGDPEGVRRRIGYVAQGGSTDPACPAGEELILQAEMYRIGGAEARRRAKELFDEFDLAGLDDRPVKTLSGGQRRRLDVALGLVHRPSLVFLDEPSAGLDPQARSNLWDHVRRLRDELNTTIFLTTHYLDEADALCDRILVIDHGRIVAEGGPDELKRRISGDVVVIEVTGDAEVARTALAGVSGVRDAVVESTALRLTVERSDQALPRLLRALDAAGVGLASIALHRPTLDDVFLTLTGRSLRDENGNAKAI